MGTTHVSSNDVSISTSLLSFIQECPTAFHVVRAMRDRLDRAGFCYLPESAVWHVRRGGSYYTIRNGSSIVAFRVGAQLEEARFRIVAAHGDSPSFKLKNKVELAGPGDYLRLNTEAYGGTIDRTWLDRPLSVAGRVMVSENGSVMHRLLHMDTDLLIIPSVAIHMDRKVNENGAIRRNADLYPLLSAGALGKDAFVRLVASELGVSPGQILSWDLFLANRQPGIVWGAEREFVSSPRIDNLQCAFAGMHAILDAHNDHAISIFACFDSEEVGSQTMQGALSTLLPKTLERLCSSLGMGAGEAHASMARSILISCDNAHAVHPNHPELFDEGNQAFLNRGVVIKEAASQRYATDAISRALFMEICRRNNVPTQGFANRSDLPGGSTLGNLAIRQAGMHVVDIGLPQLAMHSAYETAGTADTACLIRALNGLYATDFRLTAEGHILFG
ncbi:MAG: M18 family aminopeptidase [Coriobacteriales bacterium]|nr:M18 family aminopeptidase [Coriobacteriales bacterium]